MAEASVSVLGRLVVIAAQLAQEQTNGHRVKVIAKSFEAFPALVDQFEELNDFQTDEERLAIDSKALKLIQNWEDFNAWSRDLGKWDKYFKYIPRRQRVNKIEDRAKIVHRDISESITTSTKRKIEAQNVAHRTEIALAHAQGMRFREAIADAGLQLSPEYEESRALAIKIAVDVLRNGIAVQSSDQSGETFGEALERLKLSMAPFPKVAPA